MKIGNAVRAIAEILEVQNVPEPLREASLLICLAIKKDKAFLIAHPEYELRDDERSLLQDFANRRANREPYQYIAGHQEFYGLEFEVTPDVLIPRPETEILVERAIRSLTERPGSSTFLEVGVGSGCIAVSILASVSNSIAAAVDISDKALAVAGRNASKRGVSERQRLFVSDVYTNVEQRNFDLIVSNPPYVPNADLETLQPEVRNFEPYASLSDGGNGLSIVEKLIRGAANFLKPGGELLIEIGFDQSPRVENMFDARLWETIEFLPDLQGIPRIAHAVFRANTRND
jgi:release factor glutamine methyltransferase